MLRVPHSERQKGCMRAVPALCGGLVEKRMIVHSTDAHRRAHSHDGDIFRRLGLVLAIIFRLAGCKGCRKSHQPPGRSYARDHLRSVHIASDPLSGLNRLEIECTNMHAVVQFVSSSE